MYKNESILWYDNMNIYFKRCLWPLGEHAFGVKDGNRAFYLEALEFTRVHDSSSN